MKSMTDFNKLVAQREERKEGSQRQKIIVKPVSSRRGVFTTGAQAHSRASAKTC